MSKLVKAHLLISGKVQGVGFRQSTLNFVLSTNFSIYGWIKNLPDGRVEAIIEGKEREVEEVIGHCNKGSRFSKVESVELTVTKIDEITENFFKITS